MRHFKFFMILMVSIVLVACNDDENSDRDQEEQNLSELLAEIQNLANSESCTDPTNWTYTDYGSKACGGPVGYIAYPTTIDRAAFLQKVAEHRVAQQEFNRRWNISSDCSTPAEPRAVDCENGHPIFLYGAPVPSEFSIGASIGNDAVSYAQTIFDGSGDINVYNPADKTLLLQTFKNGKDDSEGFWTIRINGVAIENLSLPYSLTGAEGSITWVDESVKNLQQACGAADVLCFYSGVGVDEVKITIDSIENDVISGTFEGELYHIRVNPSVVRDTNDKVEAVNGAFAISYTSSTN